jgi:RNA polymerase sigma-70 factor (ECF subfamily)
LILLPLGLTAPFGTTICGVIALSQIRRSAGRLCGLGLALFDALLFPLLALNAMITWLVYLLMCQSLEWVGFRPGTEIAIERALLPAALLILVVNVWLVRWAWRSAKRATGRIVTEQERSASRLWTVVALPLSLLLLLGATALIVSSPLQEKRRADELKAQVEEQKRIHEDIDHFEQVAVPTAVLPPDQPVSVPPPVVVSTVPMSGSGDVDPSLAELRVTFSQPMKDGHWSWVELDEETFPEMTGAARYLENGRTCVLPVRLEAGRTYATWINVDEHKNFQNVEGTPSIPYLLIFKTKD